MNMTFNQFCEIFANNKSNEQKLGTEVVINKIFVQKLLTKVLNPF